MKRSPFLLVFLIPSFLFFRDASASVLEGATCKVSAQVTGIGMETRELVGADDQVTQYQSAYVLIEVLTVEPVYESGKCDFIKTGDVFEGVSGSNLDFFQVGDSLVAGVSEGDSNSPSGVVSFLLWEPVILINPQRQSPYPLSIETSTKSETLVVNRNGNINSTLVNGSIAVDPAPSVSDLLSSNNILIIVLVVLGMVGLGCVLFFILRREK